MGEAELQRAIAGDVLVPGADGYESVRRPPVGLFGDVRPRAIVRCTTPADVAETIAFARGSGLRLAVRSGGHCFAGRSSTRGILLDISPMNAVALEGGIATVGAGARLGDVYDALEPHGVTIAAGCGPTVGIAGLVLGGGLGILGRRHGLTSDQLAAAQVVLADGRVVDCDERRHGDLFWALRGAGGCQFGVVTTLTLRTVPAPTTTILHLQWEQRDAVAVLEAWQGWAPDAPDELAASLLLTAGGDPGRPPVVHVFGAMAGRRGRRDGAARRAASPARSRSRSRYRCASFPSATPSAGSPTTGPARSRLRPRTASPSPSSSGDRCRTRRSPRWSRTSPPTAARDRRACSTSRRGAVRTTASPRMPPPSRTAPNGS